MASNKWLNDLKTLKITTNTLRETLRNKNVTAYATDTLPTLVSKVPDLAPIEISEEDKWQPDPLWLFPDPNGTGERKTIRQIYDEDTMASSYTYRAVYQITDEFDTIDLKKAFESTNTSQTFVLSDGAVYENVTATTLEHTWNKDFDIEDSKGRKMRYIRYYCNSSKTNMSGIYGCVVWVIFNAGASLSAASYGSTAFYHSADRLPYLECVETGDKVTNISSPPGGIKFVKLKADREVTSFGCTSTIQNYIRELDFYFTNASMSGPPNNTTTRNFLQWNSLKVLDFSKYTGTGTLLQITGSSSSTSYNYSICELRNLSSTAFTTAYIGHLGLLEHIELPTSLTALYMYYMPSLREIIVPNNVTSFTMSGHFYNLRRLVLPSSLSQLSLTMTGTSNYVARLMDFVVPADFNFAVNLTDCPLLTHDSIINLLTNLKDLTGESAKTLTLGTTNLAKLTDEEKAVATNKNWKLA